MTQPQVPFGRRIPAGAAAPPSWPAPPTERLEIFEPRRTPAPVAELPLIPPGEPDPVKAELESWKQARKARRTSDLGVWRWVGVAAMLGGAVAPIGLHGLAGDAIGLLLGPTGIGLMLKGVRWRRSRALKDGGDSDPGTGLSSL